MPFKVFYLCLRLAERFFIGKRRKDGRKQKGERSAELKASVTQEFTRSRDFKSQIDDHNARVGIKVRRGPCCCFQALLVLLLSLVLLLLLLLLWLLLLLRLLFLLVLLLLFLLLILLLLLLLLRLFRILSLVHRERMEKLS